MTSKSRIRFASQPKVLLMAGLTVLAFAEGVSAFATGGDLKSGQGGGCAFSMQLQTSYETRRSYLTGLEQTAGTGAPRGSSRLAMSAPDGDDLYTVRSNGRAAGVNGLDPFSAECLSCHDGVGAAAITVEVRSRPSATVSRLNSFSSEHPLGMEYNRYVASGRGYKPLFGDANVVLVNGRVGCLSCHDPLNPQKGHLVKTDRSTSVCHSCHDK